MLDINRMFYYINLEIIILIKPLKLSVYRQGLKYTIFLIEGYDLSKEKAV